MQKWDMFGDLVFGANLGVALGVVHIEFFDFQTSLMHNLDKSKASLSFTA